MFICSYVHMFVTVLDLDHRSNGDVLCCTQFRCHLSEQPVVQNAAFAHISAECSFFSSVFENGSMFVFAQMHGSTKPNLHCCWIALGCIALSFFMTLKTDPKDLWSLRHWWTLCLLMINMLWWFLKISKIHPYDRPYDLCLWSSLQLIRGLLHPYDHYNASSLWSL